MNFYAACLPQASSISGLCLCWGSTQPENLEQQQRQWPSPSGLHQQLSPHTSLFYRVLSLSFIRYRWNNSILCFLYCTDVLIQAEWGGCLLLAELNYYLKISPAPAVPSLTAPKTFNPTVKSQWLHQGCYLRCVCLHRVKNTCNTPDQRTIAQMTPLRGGNNRYINRRRSRSGFFSCSIPFFSFPFLSSFFSFSTSKIWKEESLPLLPFHEANGVFEGIPEILRGYNLW